MTIFLFRSSVVFAKNFQMEPHWDEGYCYAKDASGKWYVIVKEGYSKPSYIPANAEIVYAGQSTKTNQRQFGETTFLGMVEWVKFYSAFNGEDEYNKADEFFQNTWKKENSLLRITRNAKNYPKVVVFCWNKEKNKPFVFEAQNFRSNWVNDVRGDYVFNNMPGTAGGYMDKEDFYEKAVDADVCILLDYTGDAETKDDLLKLNPKFANFKAYKNGRFYVSESNILLANMYDAGNVMEDYARIVHPELFSGGDKELKHFVNIKYDSISYDANYLISNSFSSTFDFVVKLVIGEDLCKCACGEEYSKVGLAVDIATLPILEGKIAIFGAKIGAKKLIPVVVKFFVRDEGKGIVGKLIKKGLSREVIKSYEKIGIDLNKLDYALDKLKGVKGYDELFKDIKKGKSGAPYEAIVAAEKCNVDEIVELSKKLDKKTYGYETEIDIETTNKIIECKGKDIVKDGSRKWQRFVEQLRKLSDYSKTHNKELVYYFKEQPNDDVIRKLNEFGAKYVLYKP